MRQIVDALCKHGQLRVAAIVQLARSTGIRFVRRSWRTCQDCVVRRIALGRSTNRMAPKVAGLVLLHLVGLRWMSIFEPPWRLREQVSPVGSRNMVAFSESYKEFVQRIVGPARDVQHAHDFKGFHELRAAFACERYQQITQHRAPVNGGQCCAIDRRLDHEARMQISRELGHGRVDVVASYIGGRV